ncbi:MAG: hypothetical protein KDC95_00015 [Planctomycetes bacterium]|nr:hypothetical protein [Planctomycetota bacterium]
MRLFPWLAIGLLATACFLASGFFGTFETRSWVLLLALGVVCSMTVDVDVRARPRTIGILAACTLPAVFVLHDVERIGPLLMLGGFGLVAVQNTHGLLNRAGRGALFAGGVWIAQSVTMFVYGTLTARVPELPRFLTEPISFLVGVAGVDHALDGARLVMFSMRAKHALALTWSWFADPGFACFFVAGTAFLVLRATRGRLGSWLRFVGICVVWLFVRATVSATLFMHTALLTDYDEELAHAKDLWNPWFDAAYLLPLVLFLAWLVRAKPSHDLPASETSRLLPLRESTLAGLAGFAVILGFFWFPSGERKAGRVLIDEYHSQVSEWTRSRWPAKRYDTVGTQRPYDTEWYGEDAAYNYASLYEYCALHYDVDRLLTRIDDTRLANVDVLVLKVPTREFEDSEVRAVLDFTKRGGGLLLIGEHTSVFGSGVSINQIARELGFEFRYDCLFGIDEVFHQSYEPWLMPHPASQHMGPMEFAISCSIDPGFTWGTAFLRGIGLKNLDADYHARNAYPQPNDSAQMLAGSFVQGFATDFGEGRVLAFTDSTIMANFSFFEPGKSELFLGMLEWLDHEQGMPTSWLALTGLALALGVLVLVIRRPSTLVPAFTFALLGSTIGIVTVHAANATSMPFPERKRPCVAVGFDRSLCTAISLPERGFIGGKDDGYGLFERAIQRLTKPVLPGEPGLPWITRRVTTLEDPIDPAQLPMLTLVQPSEVPTASALDNLKSYVEHGGTLVVMSTAPGAMLSPKDADARKDANEIQLAIRAMFRIDTEVRSTANAVLEAFGLRADESKALAGTLHAKGFPDVEAEHAVAIEGGDPFVVLETSDGNVNVGMTKAFGRGKVVALGFASRFRDTAMGITPDVIPDETVRSVYDFEFALWRSLRK